MRYTATQDPKFRTKTPGKLGPTTALALEVVIPAEMQEEPRQHEE